MADSPPQITVVDCETTGLDSATDRVIEVAALKLDRGLRVIDRYVTLVRSSQDVPLQTARLTGITDADLANAPEANEVWPSLAAFVGGTAVVGHNAAFDLGFVFSECNRAGVRAPACTMFDTLIASVVLFPELDRHGLDHLAAVLGLPAPSHRAERDAEAAAALLVELCCRARELPEQERALLYAAGWEPLRVLDRIAKTAQVRERPGRARDSVAEAGGTSIADVRADPTGVPPDEHFDAAAAGTLAGHAAPGAGRDSASTGASAGTPPKLPVEGGDWSAVFGEDGPLADRLPGYHTRAGQVELAGAAAAIMEAGGIGVFEAGTGMGKSLAYLVPAAFRSAATGTRVVVSTKTKALQRQLAANELPLLAQMIPGWRWAVLMGRENYLCERALREAGTAALEIREDAERLLALAYLSGRARRTDVDLSGLPYGATLALPALAAVAASLRSSTARCARRACHWRGRCHWRLARARAASAHLVCVNHALLLTGVGVPYHEDVVIDEAHLLPDEAQAAFSQTVDRLVLAEIRRDLGSRRRPLADQVRSAAAAVPPDDCQALLAAADDLQAAAAGLSLRELELAARLATLMQASGGAADDGYDRSLRLRAGLRETPEWDSFSAACDELGAAMSSIAAAAGAIAQILPEEAREAAPARSLAERAAEAARTLATVTEVTAADHVVWATLVQGGARRSGRRQRRAVGAVGARGSGQTTLAAIEPPARDAAADAACRAEADAKTAIAPSLNDVVDARTPAWSLTSAPLSPAPGIRSSLWERLRSAVLVSATLTVRGSFAYFNQQAGLSADLEAYEQAIASPFDYRRQAVLILEHEPSRPWDAGDAVVRQTERLRELTEVTGGRLLALFTNKKQMNQVAGAVGQAAQADGVLLLAQGMHGSAAALADEFRAHPSTVLLGVDALWTGQDFPGDTLVCLVIAKLPFPRQDPLFEARREAAEQDGRDWFRDFYLPEAVLRFRQGFGRLIRTESDRGVIVVLDHRLTQKRYLDDFLRSLPDIEVVRAEPAAVAEAAAASLRRLGCIS